LEHLESGQNLDTQPLALAHAPEEWFLFIVGNAGRRKPDLQILCKLRMASHLVDAV
jgi:hypothetical protein